MLAPPVAGMGVGHQELVLGSEWLGHLGLVQQSHLLGEG